MSSVSAKMTVCRIKVGSGSVIRWLI